jgi:carboxyl-terminal processing protease
MPRRILAVLISGISLSLFGATPSLENRIPRDDRRLLQNEALFIIELLQDYHYASRPFRDLDSPEFLDRYLSRLDPDRLIFTAGDVGFLHRRFDRNLKTVYLFAGDLRPGFEIYDFFAARANTRSDWILARLQRPFDLNHPGTINLRREESLWPADAAAADALWEQWLQARLVGAIARGASREEALARERDFAAKSHEHLAGVDPLVVREQFLTCLLEFFDPHSGYFSRENADEFDVEMTGAVVGIGLDLQAVGGRFLVQAVRPGGPCDLSGEIWPGDEIVSVAEGKAPARRLAGLRLRDVVRLIRGNPGSRLALAVRAAGHPGDLRPITLTRARVNLPADHARALLVRVPGASIPRKIGVIVLPTFYGSEAKDGVSVSMSAEVRDLVRKLAEAGAQALVVDVRDNPGGLLIEGARLTGLFLQGGPLVFTQGLAGKPEILHDDDPTAAFAGPLVVLTSPQSASASEVFSGALQCYRRALVVGTGSTFGKGTVQSYMDLHILPNLPPEIKRLGGVARVTDQLYYLPDGRSPQSTGVLPDIVLPAYRPPGLRTESLLPHALPATTISPPEKLPVLPPTLACLTPDLLQRLQTGSRERVARLPEFALHQHWIDFLHDAYDAKEVAVQLDRRLVEQARQDELRNSLRAEGRRLGEQLAFPFERIDLSSSAEAAATHQIALRSRRREDGSSCVNQYDRGIFYYQDAPDSPIRDIAIDALNLDVGRAAAAELSVAWTKATSTPLETARVRAILADLQNQRENPDPEFVLPALFLRHLDAPLDDAALARGITAFFRAAIELQPHLLRDMPPLDVVLRESLRLAADWVDAMPVPTPSGLAAATPAHP